ncbi:hypothetical protein [Rathayibacter tanaceti]|uniref:Uncharacterized protein n=1 Tax=Rathayibacter tanaceti TaxID=1671680 RepID=A0ACD2XMP8_9MICO|nr:hypothetical protein [Rathayibacter tanaceti]TCO39186.1 hypothetical protein EV639_101128 [Rathayibacter tanaceti]
MRSKVRRTMVGAAIAAVVAVLAGCTPPEPPPLAAAKVLQSVSIGLSTNGAVGEIEGTALGVGEDPSDTTVATTTYDPAAVAADLPVRVRSSWRTADASGTDLAELAGRSGRVEISLAVENLTVHAEEVAFDVAGRSASRSALVGAPLTVAASTVLPGVSPSNVVTEDESGTVTNGVLSRDDHGDAVVQWASLLAPPGGGATATLTLVADVDDFAVPAFDLAVQPGLSTDPTTAGALDAAFDSGDASPLALERRTIEVITSVDDLLTQAGTTVAEVRTSLDATSETLGIRTAEELRTSTASTAASMQGLSGQLATLKTQLSSTVSGTESGLLQQLSQAIDAVDAMLGDTSAAVPSPELSGSGCTVAATGASGTSGSIYSELLRLTSELDAYGTAAASCRDEVVASLRSAVGPAEPSAQSCAAPSMTCSLAASGAAVDTVLLGMLGRGQSLVDSLQPELMAGVESDYAALSSRVDATSAAVDALADPSGSVAQTLAGLSTTLDGLDTDTGELEKAVTSVGATAKTALDELGTPTTAGSLSAQNHELADRLCELLPAIPAPTIPAPATTPRATSAPSAVPRGSIEELRAYLTGTPCSGKGRLDTPDGYSAPMADRLRAQVGAWTSVASITGDTGAGADLAALRTALASVRSDVAATGATAGADDSRLAGLLAALRASAAALSTQRDALGARVDALGTQQDALAPAIQQAFAEADSAASSAVAALLDAQVRRVSTRSAADADAITAMFDRSVSGLHEAAADIGTDGAATVDAEHQALSTAEARIGEAVTERTRDSLASIATTIDASTRDTDGASALLAADLHKVLLDLGDRTVGGSGLLGSMTTSAAKVGTADVQLALASQSAQGYAAVRSEDVSGILLAQAQERASIQAADTLPAFHLDVPEGAHSQTVYSFRIGDGQ